MAFFKLPTPRLRVGVCRNSLLLVAQPFTHFGSHVETLVTWYEGKGQAGLGVG